MKRSRKPRCAQPDKLENDRLAEPRSATEETDSPTLQRRRTHDADRRDAVFEQRDQTGPHRHPAHEVLGAVDWVDDPLSSGESGGSAELLAYDAVVRPFASEHFTQVGFDRPIGVGYRSQIRFGVDAQVERAEPGASQHVCTVGQRQRQRQIVLTHDAVLSRPYHGRVWEFLVLLLLVTILLAFLAPRFIPRGPRGALTSGTLLVTGVSPRPDAGGEQYVTIAGVINGPTVNEHAVYQRMAVNVDAWPVMGQLFPVVYSPKNPDNWKFAPPEPPAG